MRRLGVAVAALAAGCGRLGFDALLDARAVDARVATPALVGQTTQIGSASPVTLPVSVGGGHLIIVAALGGNTQIASIHDGAPGNTYVSANAREIDSGNEMVELWYAANSQPVTGTMTITFAATTGSEIWVAEFSGVATSSPLDTIAGSNGPTPGDAPGATVTTSRSNELVFTILGLDQGGTVTMLAAGSPFAALPILDGDDTAYGVAATPGTYAPTWDIASANVFVTSSAAFLPGTL